MLLMGSTNASAKDSQIVNWILVMIIFGATSNPSGISHMEVLKVYQVQKECSDAITKALSIKRIASGVKRFFLEIPEPSAIWN